MKRRLGNKKVWFGLEGGVSGIRQRGYEGGVASQTVAVFVFIFGALVGRILERKGMPALLDKYYISLSLLDTCPGLSRTPMKICSRNRQSPLPTRCRAIAQVCFALFPCPKSNAEPNPAPILILFLSLALLGDHRSSHHLLQTPSCLEPYIPHSPALAQCLNHAPLACSPLWRAPFNSPFVFSCLYTVGQIPSGDIFSLLNMPPSRTTSYCPSLRWQTEHASY